MLSLIFWKQLSCLFDANLEFLPWIYARKVSENCDENFAIDCQEDAPLDFVRKSCDTKF